MKYNLAAMVRRVRNPRRSEIVFRKIIPPGTLASNLYAAAYDPVIKAWQAALPDIMAQYERSLAALTQDSPEEMGATISAVEQQANALSTIIRFGLSAWATAVEKWQRAKWRGAVLVATAVDIGTLIWAGDMRMPMGAAIERNVALVRSVSDQTRQRISQAVFDGLRARTPPREVAKGIQDAIEMSKRRARNIASDQLTKITSELAAERRREAGLHAWQWVSSHKVNYREMHKARDGKRYSDSKPPPDLPGQLINCGCTERAVLSLDGEF